MRKTLSTIAAAGALCGLLSSPAVARQADSGSAGSQGATASEDRSTSAKSQSGSDQTFVRDAAQESMAEVKVGQLAADKASNDSVKQFGKRLIQDHTKANDQLKQIAAQKNFSMPTGVKPKHQQTYNHLAKLSGTEFDRAFVTHMVEDHEKAVKMFEQQSKTATDPQVKQFASSTLPTLKSHLAEAERLQKAVGGSGARGTTGTTGSTRPQDKDHEGHGATEMPDSEKEGKSPPTKNPSSPPAR